MLICSFALLVQCACFVIFDSGIHPPRTPHTSEQNSPSSASRLFKSNSHQINVDGPSFGIDLLLHRVEDAQQHCARKILQHLDHVVCLLLRLDLAELRLARLLCCSFACVLRALMVVLVRVHVLDLKQRSWSRKRQLRSLRLRSPRLRRIR